MIIQTDLPHTCSLGVLSLISLICPLTFEGTFFPYFTIFDTDFKEINDIIDSDKQGSLILGVTNPFFMKVFNNCNNVFQIKEKHGILVSKTFSKQKACIQPVDEITSQLMSSNTNEALAINNALLRKHFRELNLDLLEPFTKYFSLNLQKLREMPYSDNSTFMNFDEAEFIRDLAYSDQFLPLLKYTSRPNVIKIYEKFIKSNTFYQWFAAQRQKASFYAHVLQQEAIHHFDLDKVLPKLSRSQCQDIFSKIEVQIKIEESEERIEKLKDQLEILHLAISNMSENDEEYVFL